jgi:predicted lipase
LQGFTGYSPVLNAVIICFRGSTDITNWIVDLDSFQVNHPICKECEVHEGFYDAYLGVSPILKSEVSKLLAMYRGVEVLMTGHSLGGALTSLASYDLLDSKFPVSYIYTYGQPRVGNQAFATAM